MAVQLLKNYTALYSDQVPYHLSLSSHQLLYSSTISTIFQFSSHISSSSSGRFSLIDSRLRFSSSVSYNWVEKFFTRDMILLRLISFPTEFGCSHFPPVFILSLSHRIERFFTKLPLLNRWLPRSLKLASQKEGNCDVMVTRPTNHMISTPEHSNNQLT